MRNFLLSLIGFKGLKLVFASIALFYFMQGFYIQWKMMHCSDLVQQMGYSSMLLNSTLSVIATATGSVFSHLKGQNFQN